MNKSTLFAVVLSTLLLSLGLTAKATVGRMLPLRTIPVYNQEIPSTQGVSQATFIFPGGGDIGIEALHRTGRVITISRDNEVVATVDCTDRSAFSNPGNNPSAIVVNFPLQKTPGIYTVTIPQNLVEMAIDYSLAGGGEEEDEENEDDPSARLSAEFSLQFEIVASPEFTVTPAPGKVIPTQLHRIEITYPEGAVVFPTEFPTEPDTENENGEEEVYSVGLYRINEAAYEPSDASVLLTEYYVEYEGNKVILTAIKPNAITPRRMSYYVSWDVLKISSGMWNILCDGTEYHVPGLELGKYDITDPVLKEFEITPANNSGESLLPASMRTITIHYPTSYKPSGNARQGAIMGYLRQCGTTPDKASATSGFIFGTYLITDVDTQNHTITAEIKPVGNDNSYLNNLEEMETGYYSFYLNGMLFSTPNGTSSAVDFPGFHITGKSEVFPSKFTVENISFQPNIVNPDLGFSTVTLNWPFPMGSASATASVELLRDGEPYLSIPMAGIDIPANGARTMQLVFDRTIKDAGTYTLSIAPGVFRQLSYGSYLNGAVNFDIIVPGPTSYTPSPAAGMSFNNAALVDKIDTVTLTYSPDCTLYMLDDSDASSIVLQLLDRAGIQNPDYLYKASAISAENNIVTITFDQAIEIATGSEKYAYRLNIPDGLWIVDRFENGELSNGARYYYRIENPVEGTINLSGVYDLDITSLNLNEIEYESPVQPITGISSLDSAYLALADSEGDYTPVSNYSASLTDPNHVTFRAESEATAQPGKYRFVIPSAGCLDYLFCGTSHPEYQYDFEIIQTTDVSTLNTTEPERYTVYNLQGIMIKENASKSEIDSLPAGLYIINGKKLIR